MATGTLVLSDDGEVPQRNRRSLADRLTAAIDRVDSGRLEVDMTHIVTFGGDELGAFILAGMRAHEHGVALTLTHCSSAVMHVLLLSGLAPLFLGTADAEAVA